MSSSALKAPYNPKEKIEAKAVGVIEAYYQKPVDRITLPIDVEELIQNHLQIGFEVDNLEEREGMPGIDGAIYFEKNLIVIDSRLDPTENPSMERRFRYTCGHEAGHSVLHRDVKPFKNPDQLNLFEAKFEPFALCRVNEAPHLAKTEEDWIEWQADYFSAALLMPKGLVNGDFKDYWGEALPADEGEIHQFTREMADRYLVSKIAMFRRITDLKLLVQPGPLFSAEYTS